MDHQIDHEPRHHTPAPRHVARVRRIGAAIAGAGLGAVLLGLNLVASAQDQSAATPEDAILARKALMDAVEDRFNPIERASLSGELDLVGARAQSDTISVMLMAFAHLFPPATNQWKDTGNLDPVADTLSSPDVWTDFADFYRRAADASRIAFRMGRAGNEEEFKGLAMELRVACEFPGLSRALSGRSRDRR